MAFVDKTPEGRYRAYFRDPEGKQRSKTFGTKKDANALLAEIEASKSRGTYVSPHAGRLFGDHARRWMATWNTEPTTAARDRSVMETHVLPRWGAVQLVRSITSPCRSITRFLHVHLAAIVCRRVRPFATRRRVGANRYSDGSAVPPTLTY